MLLELAATVVLTLGQAIGSTDPVDYRETAGVYVSQEIGDSPFYPWASATAGQGQILGQSVSDLYAIGAGVGYQHDLTPRIKFKAEAGIAYPINRNKPEIQQEVIYTYLVGNHYVDQTRPPPVDVPCTYCQDSYETTWHIDYGSMIRFGLEFEATEHMRVTLGYRYFQPKGLMEIYDQESKDNGGGWWQEYRSIDMSTIQLGIGWEF